MDQILTQTLKDLGFNEKEASVYLALLELSGGTVTQISNIINLKRSIIYVILNGLIKKGYVSELPDKKINEYQAIDPSIIFREMRLSVKNFGELVPLMHNLSRKGSKPPKIQFIENKKAIWKIFNDITFAKNTIFISSYKQMDHCFQDAINDWIKIIKNIKGNLNVRHIIPDNPEEIEFGKRFKNEGQLVRVLSGVKQYDLDLILHNDKFFVTSLEENPFMVVIQSQALTNSLKPIFEATWKIGKEI